MYAEASASNELRMDLIPQPRGCGWIVITAGMTWTAVSVRAYQNKNANRTHSLRKYEQTNTLAEDYRKCNKFAVVKRAVVDVLNPVIEPIRLQMACQK